MPCGLTGAWVEQGKYPHGPGPLVRDIGYNSAVRYFGFNLGEE